MNKFFQSISNIVKGGARSFARFPASMIGALVIAVTASILIQLERDYNEKLFTSLQMAFFLGAIFGMALAAAAVHRGKTITFWLANLAGVILAAAVFLLIYLPEGRISEITGSRIVAGSAISFLLFLLVISRDKTISDFNQSLFMTLKSFVIALIYGLVILLGVYFVAFAVESLLYEQMSSNVYQHIAVWSLFIGFAFFLGNFPSFGPDKSVDDFAAAQKQPRFIEILFVYVIIPLMTALSVVLLIWAIQILIVGDWPSFTQLSAIFSSYSLFGIWLYFMVSHHEQEIAVWYRRLFPFTALLFLAFEAYAIIDRVLEEGLKTGEYFVSVIWLYAVISAIVLLFVSVARNRVLAWLAVVIIALIVMPAAGYQDLPAAAQTARLKSVLEANSMLADGQIKSAPGTISQNDKRIITDATEFLLRDEEAYEAGWFSSSISSSMQFEAVYGFSPVYYDDGNPVDTPKFNTVYLMLPQGEIDLGGYEVALHLRDWEYNIDQPPRIQTGSGEYRFVFKDNISGHNPRIEVFFEDDLIVDHDLMPYLQSLAEKYEGNFGRKTEDVDFGDLLYTITADNLEILLVFNSVEIAFSDIDSAKYTFFIGNIYLAD